MNFEMKNEMKNEGKFEESKNVSLRLTVSQNEFDSHVCNFDFWGSSIHNSSYKQFLGHVCLTKHLQENKTPFSKEEKKKKETKKKRN